MSSLKSDLNKLSYGRINGLCVHHNDQVYEFIFNLKDPSRINGDKVVVMGSGGLARGNIFDDRASMDEKMKYVGTPKFDRWTWDIGYSRIYYNDPTRYNHKDKLVKLGWGIGTADDWYLHNIKNILLTVFDFFGYKRHNTMFYGSSQGGFMSLMLGTMIQNTLVIADVPQFDVTTWGGFEPNESEPYSLNQLIFGGNYEKYVHRLRFVDLIVKEKYIPKAQINITLNKRDVNTQYTNFLKQFSNVNMEIFGKKVNWMRINVIPSGVHCNISKDDLTMQIKDVFSLWDTFTKPNNYK